MQPSWEEIFSGLTKESPESLNSVRRFIRRKIRSYPPRLYRSSRKWEKADLENLCEECFLQILPIAKFMNFSGTPVRHILRTMTLEVSDFMVNQAPKATRAFINQVSGLLKPKYGFVRSTRKGIGLVEWPETKVGCKLQREELMLLWKEKIKMRLAGQGFSIKAKDRRRVFRLMCDFADGWVPKNWFYNGFLELGGYQFESNEGAMGAASDIIDSIRPATYNDLEKIREIQVVHRDSWQGFLERTLSLFTGKARIIFNRLLLYEESQVEAARHAEVEPQYAFKILQKIRERFQAVLPLNCLEERAFKAFLQEYLFSIENGEPS